jgi:hypothetical protein
VQPDIKHGFSFYIEKPQNQVFLLKMFYTLTIIIQRVTMVKTIDDPDGLVFPLMLQCPQCGKNLKAPNLSNLNV